MLRIGGWERETEDRSWTPVIDHDKCLRFCPVPSAEILECFG